MRRRTESTKMKLTPYHISYNFKAGVITGFGDLIADMPQNPSPHNIEELKKSITEILNEKQGWPLANISVSVINIFKLRGAA